MKALLKLTIVFSICFLYLAAFGHFGEAWSAPESKLVVAIGGDCVTLDPHMHTQNYSFAVLRHVYDHLMERIFKDGRIQHLPMLAKSWEPINDTTWVFHLRKGVKFHNGEDFNAEAVKYTIERVLNPAQKARWRWALTFIDRVDIIDPYTVKIITKVPAPTLIINLAFAFPIVPPKYFKEKGDAYVATHPMGTGPFKFVRWIKDEEIVFEANKDHWAGAPKIKTLIFRPIPESATRVAALLGGDVDIVQKVPSHLVSMINKYKRAKVMSAPSAMSINIYLDTEHEGPLQDKRVRQAINYGVDMESIIKHVLDGYGHALASPLTSAHFGYDPSIKPYPYDPEKAKALLKEAGYEDGLTLTLHSPSGRYQKDKEFAEAIAGQLSKVGIRINVQVHEWGNYVAMLNTPEKAGPMHTHGWGGTFDADANLYPLTRCGASRSTWCNKDNDSLLEQARSTIDQEKRKMLYSQACKLIHDEAPWLFLFHGEDIYGVSNRVQNWRPTPCETTSLYMYRVSVKD